MTWKSGEWLRLRRGCQLFHQHLEGQVLMSIGRRVPSLSDALQQLSKRWVITQLMRSTNVLTKNPINSSDLRWLRPAMGEPTEMSVCPL